MSSATAAAVAAAQKKKGIKSSLGRFFSKKEKVKDLSSFIPYYLKIRKYVMFHEMLFLQKHRYLLYISIVPKYFGIVQLFF